MQVYGKLASIGGLGVMAAGLLAVGCTGFGTSSATNEVLDTIEAAREASIIVRVVNETGSNLVVEALVDGLTTNFGTCTPTEQVCDYLVTPCPQTIEIIQERRLDLNGNFAGGRNFQGNPAFNFTRGEFTCGSYLILQFSATGATAEAI